MLWYSVEAPLKRLSEALLMSIHNICFQCRNTRNGMWIALVWTYGIRYIFLSHVSLALKFFCGCVSGVEGILVVDQNGSIRQSWNK